MLNEMKSRFTSGKTNINQIAHKGFFIFKHIAVIVLMIIVCGSNSGLFAHQHSSDTSAIFQKIKSLDSLYSATREVKKLSVSNNDEKAQDSLRLLLDSIINEEYKLVETTKNSAEINNFRKNFQELEIIINSNDTKSMTLKDMQDNLLPVIENKFHYLPEFYDRTNILKVKLSNR